MLYTLENGGMVMKLFVDLDGVLCDFEARVLEIFGKSPKEIPPKVMWGKLASIDNFYGELNWMPDGRDLWAGVKHLNPTILTGIPMGNWAPKQKRSWCFRNLGWDVPVITCFAKEKQTYGHPGNILIDDTMRNIDAWRSIGGVAIHHTSTCASLATLKEFINETAK